MRTTREEAIRPVLRSAEGGAEGVAADGGGGEASDCCSRRYSYAGVVARLRWRRRAEWSLESGGRTTNKTKSWERCPQRDDACMCSNWRRSPTAWGKVEVGWDSVGVRWIRVGQGRDWKG